MLLQANMIKRLTASGGGDLEAKTGESLRIKRIECIPSTNDTYITINVDRVTVGYYRIKGKSGGHLDTLRNNYIKRNLMEYLTDKGINVTIPIAEGQTLNIDRYAEAGNVLLIYDRFSAGDARATDPNGSDSSIYTFIQYAKIGTTPAASGDHLIDTAITPSQFPDFPCDKVVPARNTIELLGIVGSPFNLGGAGPLGFATSFLKLIKDREVLFDTDRNGIPFDAQDVAAVALAYKANFSLIGSCTSLTPDTHTHVENIDVAYTQNAVTGAESITFEPSGDPLMFEPALKFEAGQELNAYITLVMTGVGVWVDDTDDQAFILRVRKQ